MWKNRLLCLGLVLCLLRRAVRPGGAKPLLPDGCIQKTSPGKKEKGTRADAFCLKYFL